MNKSNIVRKSLIPLGLAATIAAQTPTVLLDINATPIAPLDSSPDSWAVLGDLAVFAATTSEAGRELWVMDLTTRQATLLKDIAPGTASSDPLHMTTFQGHVYFQADDGVFGRELWRTDGTQQGTGLFLSLINGPDGTLIRELTPVGSRLFFTAYADGVGGELMITDGTVAGSHAIDIEPGIAHSLPSGLTPIGNEVWFRASTDAAGVELYRSDGTAAGTVLIDVVPGTEGSWPGSVRAVGSAVLFLANGRLWTTDGTQTGTSEIAMANKLTSLGSTAYFTAGANIFQTDGTIANTQLVTGITLGVGSFVESLIPVGTNFLINVSQGFFGTPATYACDGTAAGTAQLPLRFPLFYTRSPSQLYFAGSEPATGNEIWQTDGTVAGTVLAHDAVPGPTSSAPSALFYEPTRNQLLFSASTALGREPWVLELATASSMMASNIHDETGATQSSALYGCVDAAGTAYFAASTATSNGTTTLWRTDGSTTAGTRVVVPSGPNQPTGVNSLRAVGTKVFFTAIHSQLGNEIWVSDGTAAGTRVIDTYLGAESSNPSSLVVAEDLLYFLSYNPAGSRSLWRTDGTTTIAISGQIAIGVISSMAPLGRGLVFGFNDFLHGAEPYYTDGTVAGTLALGDFIPGIFGSAPVDLAPLGDRCFFTIGNNSLLAVTDGTVAGTRDFFAGVANAPTNFDRTFVVRDRLYFQARTPAEGFELWTSDGTLAGTHLVSDLVPGPNGHSITEYWPMGDLALFATSINSARGLWRTDGTATGTFQILDRAPLEVLSTGQRQAWLAVATPTNGTELWRTDGTAAGTALHADLIPGDASSTPDDFCLSGGKLLFRAKHPQLGVEPWVMDLHATSQDIGYGCTPTTSIPPLMWSDDPVLGSTIDVHVSRGPDPGISVAMISLYTTQTFALGSGLCDYFVDPGLVVLGFDVMPSGKATHPLVIPTTPSLEGERFRLQAITIPSAGLIAAELSNGITLTLGN